MPIYKHLFFDLDHTLWDFDSNAKTTLAELYTEELAKKTSSEFIPFYERYLFHNAHLWKRYEAVSISGRIKMETNVANITGF